MVFRKSIAFSSPLTFSSGITGNRRIGTTVNGLVLPATKESIYMDHATIILNVTAALILAF